MLTPGEDITPHVDLPEVKALLLRQYGIADGEIQVLPGYDDKNYLVTVSNPKQSISNSHLIEPDPAATQSAFILKITNSLDSKNAAQFEAHKELMLFLAAEGFRVPRPLRNLRGQFSSLEIFGSKNQHMVRLLAYLPGSLLKDVDLTNDLGYKLGAEVARMSSALTRFSHEFYDEYRSVWMLAELDRVRCFLYVLQDEARVRMVERVLDEFQSKVMAKLDSFQKGVIHGDINEQNILVSIEASQTPSERFSILDFGDSQYSCLVFDLAITITYMILQAQSLDIGAYILAGYSKVRKLPYNELKVLQTCIRARLCQSLVLGLYTFQEQGGSNSYVLGTQPTGWKFLELLDKYESTELMHKWTQIGRDLEDYEAD